MNKILHPFLLLCALPAFAQFGEPIIIDSTTLSAGIKNIATADLNNDGFQDIIVAQSYNIDNVAFYINNGSGGFSERQIVDADISDPVYVATGDFNNDGWQDIASITQTNGEIFVYLNTNGTFSEKTTIEEGFLFGNALVTADFDDNGFDDIVSIGQHAIDYYRNTNGTFTKEHILTTDTSPNILECMSLKTADMDNDGDMDLVTGETLGGVIYFNDGNGVFTPEIFTVDTFISRMVHVTDADNDGDNDILIHHTPGMLNLYLNNGTGEMTFHATIFNTGSNSIESMQSADIDNDGFIDIYTAFGNIARAFPNTGEIGFEDEITVHVNDNIFITQTALADIDNDGTDEYIWSGVNNTLAYQKNTTLGMQSFNKNKVTLYPNPVEDKLYIAGNDLPQSAILYNTLGQKVLTAENIENGIDVSALTKGIYIIEAGSAKSRFIKK